MARFETDGQVRGENPAALSASLLSRKGGASADGFAETALPETTLNLPDDWPRAARSPGAGGGWMLPLVLGVALLNGFGVLGWLIFGAGDGDVDAAAIPNIAALPAPSRSLVPAYRVPAETPETPETPETMIPEARGASAGPPPSSPVLTNDRAVGPATAAIVEAPAPGKAAGGAGEGGYRVQLHALSSDAAVRREWPRLLKTHGDLLGDLSLKVVRTGSGARQKTFWRMQIGTLKSAAAAKKLCDRLKRRKLDCVIVRP
jgi:hypothetical protein